MTVNNEIRDEDVEYDPDADVYRAAFEQDAVPASTAVIETVAAVMHRDALDLDPLYEYVDTDSLDSLVRAGLKKESPYLSMSFRFEDADVTVRADGTIIVAPDDL